ncbi:glycosyltransferase family 2 protein [Bailinhaonella thermotolerans]|uniref:Glycosyltransferase family 2 protein n=1 Tax=Bailinhaonella thermotolerans TaxID=1070861 RepID=A0A3A4B396_9ACTN|nr:glycosyltransferase family A protein [Bailinhaonella thermotolerans]RJL32645.1 glycosyltransferase family 2 protein [Bailinhaonella thermotolerans]
MGPTVGVVICTRGDRPRLLRAALDGVLGQDYPGHITVTVVFDRCPPDEALRLDRPGRRVLVTGNSRAANVAGARNSGVLALPDTDLIAFCDDDDEWLPGKLAAQVAALEPGDVLAACGMVLAYSGWAVDRVLAARRIELADLLVSRVAEAHPSSFLARRTDLVERVGLFAEDIPGGYGEDYDLLLRAAKAAPIRYVPIVGVRVRVHGRSSHFTGRWPTIAAAHEWLLDAHPEFARTRRGRARLTGQIALAHAASARRAPALRWSWRTLRTWPLEPRVYAALAIAARLITVERLIRLLEARGVGT